MRGMDRRNVVKAIIGTAILPGVAYSSNQTYPNKAITILVPLAAGGATDIFSRSLAKILSAELNVPVVVDNKPGANGLIAAQAVSSAKPDGYTLCMVVAGIFRQPHIENLAYKPLSSLEFVAMTNDYDLMLVARGDSPINSTADIIKLAKSKRGPIFYGVPLMMGTQHIAMTDFAKQAKIEMEAVPFKGDVNSIAALIGGDIDLAAVAGNVSSFTSGNRVKIVASLNGERSANQPNVPTLSEAGFKIAASSAMGVAGPKGMALEDVQVLEKAISKALGKLCKTPLPPQLMR